MGLQCYMVTGDNWTTARIVAAELGIINVMAEVLPAGKADKVGRHIMHAGIGCLPLHADQMRKSLSGL